MNQKQINDGKLTTQFISMLNSEMTTYHLIKTIFWVLLTFFYMHHIYMMLEVFLKIWWDFDTLSKFFNYLTLMPLCNCYISLLSRIPTQSQDLMLVLIQLTITSLMSMKLIESSFFKIYNRWILQTLLKFS